MFYSSISHLLVLGTGLLSASTMVAAQQQNTTQPDNAPSNPQVQLTSPTDFCLFLPPQPGLQVAINEDNGIPFCLNPTTVQGSQQFPANFITTAHYYKTDSYTQVTGFFDRTQYNLSITDEGGQYDSHAHHKPTGATCQNFPYFVSLIEPSNNRFCIRCCQDTEDCKTGISQRGCARVISPGNYDDNNQFDSVPPPAPQESASAGPSASASASNAAQPTASASSSSLAPGQTAAPTDGTSTGGDDSTTGGDDSSTGGDGSTTGNDDSTTGGDNATTSNGDDTQQKIPNTSYSSVLNDLDTSSSSGTTTDSSNDDQGGDDIKTVDEEAKYIQSKLADPQVDLDALKTQFSKFTTNLATTFPDAASKLKQLATITSNYQKTDQWQHLATVLQQKAPGASAAEN